jgi:23S rRNA pseudouridine1911/1915/1917 synthase
MIQQFIVTDTGENLRLGVFLAEQLGISRSQAQKVIKAGQVIVNEVVVEKPSLRVAEGDSVSVSVSEGQSTKDKGQSVPLDIIFEDPDVLVINKPTDLLVHRTMPEDDSVTLVDSILDHDTAISSVGDDPVERPGIVHRLDKMASGVMVVAKTQEAFNHLKKQFASRVVKKEYTALVYGRIDQGAGEINFRIGRSKRSGKMVAKPEGSDEGKEAITEFDVVERYRTTTLLRVRIKTGRTHQIRAHMQAFNHPIVGDTLYCNKQMNKINPMKLGRLFLHAAKLTIKLPSGETKSFEALLPDELQGLLDKL